MKKVIYSLSSLLLVSLAACTASEAEGAPPKPGNTPVEKPADKPVEAPAVAKDPVIGTWSLDSAATVESVKASMAASLSEVPEEQRQQAYGMVTEMFGSSTATLTLAADHTIQGTMSMPGMMSKELKVTNMSGTWVFDGATVTTTTTTDGNAREEVQTLTVDGNRLNVVVDQGGQKFALVFVRSH